MNQGLPNIIIIYGAIGAGKGTQVNLLQSKIGGVINDTGAELRAFSKKFTKEPEHDFYEVASRIAEMMQHQPVLTEDLFVVLKHKIETTIDSGELLIMDKPGGVLPAEAKWFLQLLEKKQAKVCFINLDISLEEAIKRSQNRWYVEGQKQPYPSKQAALEVSGGQDIYQRPEDMDQYHVTGRYQKLYTERIAELEKIFGEFGVSVNHINAEKPILEVHKQILDMVYDQNKTNLVCQVQKN
jgi:adenylate kinase family enzyme